MRTKSILTEAKQISRAVALIGLGARLQVLESETDLSYERLLRLYKEVAGKSPSKGQLPFSTDWFMTPAAAASFRRRWQSTHSPTASSAIRAA